jgi:uncharacterized protein YnzC (UPF0291/DUF896 family)
MNKEKIGRINELACLQKQRGLTDDEKCEQALLRREYIDAFKENVRATLESVRIQKEDGTLCELKPKEPGDR